MNANSRYPEEVLDPNYDDGTMPESKGALAEAVVGHRIVSAKREETKLQSSWGYALEALVLTLDNGKRVQLLGSSDCCAYTEVTDFLLNPELVDHAIMGVAVCRTCPVLTACDQAWRVEEDGSSDLRWGIRAGLTPKQRAQAAKETT